MKIPTSFMCPQTVIFKENKISLMDWSVYCIYHFIQLYNYRVLRDRLNKVIEGNKEIQICRNNYWHTQRSLTETRTPTSDSRGIVYWHFFGLHKYVSSSDMEGSELCCTKRTHFRTRKPLPHPKYSFLAGK